MNTSSRYFMIIYFTLFGSGGAFFPFLSQFFKSGGLSASQSGIIFAMSSLVSIAIQPMWGLFSDMARRSKILLIALTAAVMLLAPVMPFINGFYPILILFFIFYFFNCGIGVVLEGMLLNSAHQYGQIRLWGSIGFAVFVLISGILGDFLGIKIIFIMFPVLSLISILFIPFIQEPKKQIRHKTRGKVKELLKNRDFIFFLVICFFFSGTLSANFSFFGIYYQSLGGTVSGVGIAFLLFALSEVPIMKYAGSFIRKIGPKKLLIFAYTMLVLRWFLYSLTPHPYVIILTFFLQGLSYGVFAISIAEYIKYFGGESLKTTAMGLFSSVCVGLGSMLCSFIIGNLIDFSGIRSAYLFLTVTAFIGFLLSIKLRKI